jgi:hypothetical protein
LSRDPLGGMYPGWSPYNYVLGNPVSLTDPTGMSAEGGGDEYLYEVAEDGNPIVAMMDVRIWEPAGWATTKDLPRRTSVAYRDVKSTISASWEEHDTGLAEAIGRSLFAHQQRNYDAYKRVQGTMEWGGQTLGNFVGDFHPAMGFIKMGTGGDEVNATNVAFAAFSVIPGGGEANAGKNIVKKVLKEGVEHVDEATTTIYRAVSQAELDDIALNGLRSRGGQFGYESGKLFAPTINEAAQFGLNNFKWDGAFTIVKVGVPNSVMQNAYHFPADGMNAISISSEFLPRLTVQPLNFSPLIR